MKPVFAHAVAIGAAFLTIVLVSAGWIVHLRAGPKLDPWSAGPMVIAVPFVLLALSALWLLARAIVARWIAWRPLPVLLATALSACVVTAVTCGPVACFQQGPNRAMGWFVVGGVAMAALVHHFVLERTRQGHGNG